MSEEEPYEIISHREILDLKKEIQELKSKDNGKGSKLLIDSINRLSEQMNVLINIFKSAAEEMHSEEKPDNAQKKIEPFLEKLDAIIDQNRTIAEGIVTIADMIKEGTPKPRESGFFSNKPQSRFEAGFEFQNPPIQNNPPPPRHTPPRPMPQFQMKDIQLPDKPENPFEPKKRGLFGRIKR